MAPPAGADLYHFMELTAVAVGELVVVRLLHELVQEDHLAPLCVDEPFPCMVGVAGCGTQSLERSFYLF